MRASAAALAMMLAAMMAGCGSLRQIDRKLKQTLDESTATNKALQELLAHAMTLLETLMREFLDLLGKLATLAEHTAPVVQKTDQILGAVLVVVLILRSREIAKAIHWTATKAKAAVVRLFRRGGSPSASPPA